MNNTSNKSESNITAPAPKPKLWNPNAAANWSLIFSPAFGAILHAKNWTELGDIDKANTNKKWAKGIIIFLLIVMLIPSIPILDRIIQLVGLILLLKWYFSHGRKQAKYVKEKYGQDYEKKKWGQPILIGIGCFIGYIICAIIMSFIYSILLGVPTE
jgi:hypothetical protein